MNEFKLVMLSAERELIALKQEAYDLASGTEHKIGTFNILLGNYAEQVKVEEWLTAAKNKMFSEGGGE